MPATAPNQKRTRLEALQGVFDSGTLQQTARLLNALTPAEIAHFLESLPQTERQLVWELIPPDKEGEVLVDLSDEVRDDLIEDMDGRQLVAAVADLPLDDLADLVQDLPESLSREVISSLDSQHLQRLKAVLSYPEDTAGGLMNTDTVTVRPEVTLDVVLRYLRLLAERVPKSTDTLFVINRDDKYLGALSLTALVTHDPEATVAEVMSLDLKPIPADWEARKVAERFEQHDLLSAPVVDSDGKLLGRITVDDVIDFIREEGEHQFMGQAGLSEEEDMFAPVVDSARRRAIWLGVNLGTAFLASWVISQFEDVLQQFVALAVLMPIVASMGGIAGSQTLTLTIRGIALGQLNAGNSRWLIVKELAVGAINSLIWALVVAAIALIWLDDIDIAGLIGVAMTLNLLIAALAGAVLPLILNRLHIDPALAGGVILTTVTDIVGFFAFLGLARVFLM